MAIAEGNLPEARRLFNADLAVAQRLAASDPGNAGWQRDLAVSYIKLAGLEKIQETMSRPMKLLQNAWRS